jgi:flagellar biogenesis protein FliO
MTTSEAVNGASGAFAWTNTDAAPGAGHLQTVGQLLTSTDISLTRIVAALVFCLLLAVAAIFLIRRTGMTRVTARTAASSQITVLERTRLNPGTTLYLVGYGQTHVLLACDSHGVKTLHSQPSTPEQNR